MAKSFFCFLCFLLLQIVTTQSHLSGGVSISIGGVRGAVRIGRGITRPAPPDSKLSRVYTALQAWKSAITDDPNKGVLVKELSLITDMSLLDLNSNRFSSNIPFSLANVGPRLNEIFFINNQLTGCTPEGIRFWQDLRVLDASRNSLSGHLPGSISCLNDIEVLNLAHNRFSGELSDSVCSQGSLVELIVASNFFSDLGHECGKLSNRNVHFDFSGKCFTWQQRQRLEPESSVIPRGG
ncbi:hypothetical protein RHMOL_Rhmol05G0035900 [Rhododendron molle]|uniref:Uncharacterized protein n=1 Tax=Rhododendron molle TaxID=49168 RepID=A0ACC0NLD4_RHOML|nr:hypothetical protein RHMOL_Rhmol05G0035900 [Rhododendron molle]